MPVQQYSEATHRGEFILSEVPRSRDIIVIAQSQALNPGTVLGYSSVGALAGAFTRPGATGNPTCGAITVTAGTPIGEYDLVMDDPTHFHVLQPPVPGTDVPGEVIGEGVFGSAFSAGGLGFTITAGGTACIASDILRITVTQSGALNQYAAFNPAGTDGTQNAAGISLDAVTTGAGQNAKAIAITRDAQVKAAALDWGAASGGQIAAATSQLAQRGIIVRP
ncbi:MAG: head decoration protein [Caulobacterales bacterium]